jgi:hypothetical protein
VSCSTAQQKLLSTPSLEAFDTIELKTTQAEDLRKFGAPVHVGVDKREGMQARILTFCAAPATLSGDKLVFRLDQVTGKVLNASWTPRSSSPEVSIEGVLKHYSDFTFEKQSVEYNFGHYFYHTDYYMNSKHGLVIEFDADLKKVTRVFKVPSEEVVPVVAKNVGIPTIKILSNRSTASSH